MIKKERFVIIGVVAFLISFASIAMAGSLFDIQFIMIAVNDAKATIKNGDGTLQVIQPGDIIAGTYTVKKIAPGRITLENSATDGPKVVIVRLEYGRQWLEPLGNNRMRTGPFTNQQNTPSSSANPAPATQ